MAIKEWLEENGELFEASGNNAFFLDEPGSVYFLKTGQLDVFFVSVKDGEPVGKRSQVFRATPGCGLFGIDPDSLSAHVKLQCVGKVGTEVYKIDRNDLVDLTRDEAGLRSLTEMANRWFEGLSGKVTSELSPRDFLTPKEARKTELNSGDLIRPREGLAWIRLTEGEGSWVGNDQFVLDENDGWFPLTEDTWLTVDEDTKLNFSSTEELLTKSAHFQQFDSCLETFMERFIQQAREERQALVERARTHSQIERENKRKSFRKLVQVIKRSSQRESYSTGQKDPLLVASKIVGSFDDIEVLEPPESDGEDRILNPLEEISKASGFRTRRVRLKNNWWNRDNGALLGFLSEEEEPVALLPEGTNVYEMVVPSQDRRETVDEEVAEQLLDHAYQFYPPLPEKELSGKDVIGYAANNLTYELTIVVLMGLAGTLLGLLTPILTQFIFGTIIPNAQTDQLFFVSAGLILAALGMAFFQVTRSFALLRMESRIEGNLQAAMWDRLLNLPVPFFREYSVGDLAQRVSGIQTIRQKLSGHVINTIISGVFSISNFFLLFYYSWKLALIALALVISSSILIGFLGYLRVRYQRAIHNLEGEVSSMMHQFLEGISKIRVAGAEMKAFSKFADKFSQQREQSFKAGQASNYEDVFSGVLPVISSMVIFGSVAFLMGRGPDGLTTGVFLAFNSAYGQFQSAGLQLSQVGLSLMEIIPLWERAQPILKNVPEVQRDRKDPGVLSGAIEMKGVDFRYEEEGELILDDLSLEIEAGEFVALVGPSGSGKSTIMRVMLGFEKPEAGGVYYDGQDLSGLDLHSVRRQIGTVLQNARVQSGNIKKNIIGSSSHLTEDDAWEAAEKAGLADEIEEMPMGMYTVLMEGGGSLSGGQRQRLIIARAIVRNPRILFFDEATSALDNETQSTVTESTDRLDATRVVIAHRLSTIKNADRIIVVEDGSLAEQGDYEELMNKDGLFARLAERQLQ